MRSLRFKSVSILVHKYAVIYAILSLLLFLLFAFNNVNPDYTNYLNMYNSINAYNGKMKEPLFKLLMIVFHSNGASYQLFRLVISLIAVLVIVTFLWRYSPYPNLALLLYFLYPFTLDVTQLRQSLGLAMILVSLHIIIEHEKRKQMQGIVLFSILMAIGTLFHYSCLLFIPLYIMFVGNRNIRHSMIVILPIIIILCVITLPLFSSVLGPIVGYDKVDTWVGVIGELSIARRLAGLIIRIVPIISIFLLRKLICKYAGFSRRNVKQCIHGQTNYQKETDCLFDIMLIVSAISVLEVTTSTVYERQGRIAIIVYYILATRLLDHTPKYNRKVFFAIVFCSIMMLFIYYMIMSPGDAPWIETVFLVVLRNNELYS